MLDALFEVVHIEFADALEHLARLFVGAELAESLVVFLRLLEVAEAEESVGLVEDGVRVVGIDGDGKFAALDGVTDVVVHELRRGQMVPVGRGVGVGVDEFVEDALALLVVARVHGDSAHEFLVVGVVGQAGAPQPFRGHFVVVVVGVERGHVEDEVFALVFVVEVVELLVQIVFGGIVFSAENHEFGPDVVVFGMRLVVDFLDELLGAADVVFVVHCHAGQEGQRLGGSGKHPSAELGGLHGGLHIAIHRVVFGNVGQFLGVEIGAFASFPGGLVSLENLLELVALEIFVVF